MRSFNGIVHTNVSAMGQIEQSPYEGPLSAEVGEYLFEYTYSMMNPERGLDSAQERLEKGPSEEAIEIFGEEIAESILQTSRLIAKSGVLFASGWTDGNIQGVRCRKLEKDLLLLCLYDHRIARSEIVGIKYLVKELDLWKMVSDALSLWKLDKKYPRLARCANIQSFKKRQSQCLKCIVFIARAVACMKYLEWDFPAISDDTSLKTKINACLGILEYFVSVNETKKVRKKVPKKLPVVNVNETKQVTKKVPTTVTAQKAAPMADLGILASKGIRSNLSNLLRSKDSKIVGVEFHTLESKKMSKSNATQMAKVSKSLPLKKRAYNELSGVSLPKNQKKQRTPFSHVLFDTKSNASEKNSGNILPNVSIQTNVESCLPDKKAMQSSLPDKKATKFSHALFDVKNHSRENVVDVPNNFSLTGYFDLPSYVSDESMLSDSSDPNFWYPVDDEEIILNPLQVEAAWLVEESMYCNRNSSVDWTFVMIYASPALQIELRQISDATNDEESLSKLVYNGVEAKRFAVLRREIRRKLLKNVVRTRMQGILPRLRRATHPVRLQKLRLKRQMAIAQN